MGRFILTERAPTDLAGIWRYAVSHWGDDQAERYVRDIWNMFERVAENPKQGRPFGDIRADHFRVQAGSHVVIYRAVEGGVGIVRVLHQSMDFARHL